MNTRFVARILCAAVTAALTAPAVAADLEAIYQRALANDPQIREADANRRAARESKPQALAALLPQIEGEGNYDDFDRTNSFTDIDPPDPALQTDQERKGDTTQWQLSLRQNVFSWQNWADLRRASAEVAQAESDYQAAQQDLILRVSEAYFNVLAAQDTLEAATAAHDAIARQLEQSEKRFEVGLIAVTDVQEAKAAFDSATAALIQAKRNLATTGEQLRELTGEAYAELERPGDDMPLAGPSPADPEEWVRQAMDQNARLISSRLAADIARHTLSSERGGHLPSLDLVVTHGDFDTQSDVITTTPAGTDAAAANSEGDDTTISLQVTVPIFSGGATQSRVRQAGFRHVAARERLERTARQTERETRDAFLGVNSEVARVQSLRQAVESAKTALQATEAGYEVGTRTSVDVLDARRRLFEAETIYARSRYDYLLNVLRLRLAAGTLDPAELSRINGLLTENVSVR